MMLTVLCGLLAIQSSFPGLVPLPSVYRPQPGSFLLNAHTRIVVDASTRSTAELFRTELGPGLALASTGARGTSVIRLKLDPTLGGLGSEGYRLSIEPHKALMTAPTTAGLFYACQTFRQMLPVSAFASPAKLGACSVPCAQIEDHPRFSWRGAHIDVCRHFMPFLWLLKFVDLLALHKMNVLHLHLTDDQGWRMEIKRYPKLTEIGSKRSDTQLNDEPMQFEGKPHSGFYTQKQLRELVAYAAARHVTVVPEIEMPGHSRAAIAAYPELGNTGRPITVATTWGIHRDILNVQDSTIKFYENVLDEVMEVFPSQFIHTGGDEAPKDQWTASEAAQTKRQMLGLKDMDELQSWFTRQIEAYLAAHGRRLIGWDEILQGGLAPGAAVMSWRGEDGGIAAANSGHDVVMAPNDWTYLDQAEVMPPQHEPIRAWGYLPAEKVLRYDPMPRGLSPEGQKRILGAETALWTESIRNEGFAEYMLFPRVCAFSEAVWDGPNPRFSEFRERLKVDLARLDAMGVRHHPLPPVPSG